MTNREEPCIDEAAKGLSADAAASALADNIEGCDFVCHRVVGGIACRRFFRYESADSYGVTPRSFSHEQCQIVQNAHDIAVQERLQAEEHARREFAARSATVYIADEAGRVVGERAVPTVSDGHAQAQQFASQRYDASLYRDEDPADSDLIGGHSMQVLEVKQGFRP